MAYGENSLVCWESGMSQEYSKQTDRKAWLLKDNDHYQEYKIKSKEMKDIFIKFKIKSGLNMVAHTYNPRGSGG